MAMTTIQTRPSLHCKIVVNRLHDLEHEQKPSHVGTAIACKASNLFSVSYDLVNVFGHTGSMQYLRKCCMCLKECRARKRYIRMSFKLDNAVTMCVLSREKYVQSCGVSWGKSENCILVWLALSKISRLHYYLRTVHTVGSKARLN